MIYEPFEGICKEITIFQVGDYDVKCVYCALRSYDVDAHPITLAQ